MGTGIDLLKSDAVLWLADFVITVVLLKGTVLAALVAVVVTLAGRASWSMRATLWTCGFAALLLLPLTWTVVPWWPAEVILFPTGLFEPVAAFLGTIGGVAPGHGFPTPDAAVGGLASVPPASFLALVWAAGAVALLGRFGAQRLLVERIARTGEDAASGPRPDPCLAIVREVARELGIRRPLRLVHHHAVATPATFGIGHPVVLLPNVARVWPEERLRAVLYHELAHVQRHDYASLLLFEVSRAVYWLNPLVLFAAARARESQDHACDDAALRSGVTAPAYARHLTEVARALRFGPTPGGALPLVRRSGLRGRVRAVLDPRWDRSGVSRPLVGRLAVLGLVLATALGSANLWICEAGASAPTASEAPLTRPDTPRTS